MGLPPPFWTMLKKTPILVQRGTPYILNVFVRLSRLDCERCRSMLAVFYHNVSVWFWIVYCIKRTKIFCCQWYLGCKQKSFPVLRLSHEDDISTNVHWFCHNRPDNIVQEIPLLCPWIYAHCTPIYLEKESNNQNGNLRWFLPWREGGLEFHLPILKNVFLKTI